ncbi:MAG: carbohydrate kinase [Chromatiaceae bacterium]|nr:carbohydrate kinase [Chromatiaceae bacterium]
MPQPALCIFGEVLFDCFPDGRKVLGGAPFNVAWHLAAFGAHPRLISAVGEDAEGGRIRDAMRAWGMDSASVQTDPHRPTGRVEVSLHAGEPSFDILADCAWDHIRAPDASQIPCGLLYHGTLALRQPVSAGTLETLKAAGPELVFLDVNLRRPWWSREQTLELLNGAHWVKLNRDELHLLAADASENIETLARTLAERHQLRGLVVTLGAEGALAVPADGALVCVAPQPALEVVDTVGAGDAFAAVTLLGILHGWPLETLLARAQSFASRIVGQRGATDADPTLYQGFIKDWTL